MDPWFDVAVVATIFAIGNILFGHFEARTPKWRRVLKVVLVLAVTFVISTTLGRPWSWIFVGVMLAIPIAVHGWWLPKHGVNGWTGEPKARYYELRGWKLPEAE